MYTEKVMDHFMHPRNVGEIDNASGVGTVGNAKCGDIMRIFLDIDALYVFSAEAFDKWVEGLFAGREGHEGFNPRDINDQKLMRAINKRTTSMDVDSAGRIGLSESLRKQANLDREVTVVGNYDHLEVWDRAAADEDDDDEALLDLFFS